MWGGIALLRGIASLIGYAALENASEGLVAFITAVTAGGILADTVIPEAFEQHHNLGGLTVSIGFLTAFTIHQIGG